ncbi:cytochrome P450 2A5-like isoform X2 [Hyperolius riggenbachi]|uniref:cytochrome P450 2A5-like isoform X2 n=1 Tax=Hyperolius riggenbachi TaxID=752182 RepID=UPI0035A3A488
MAMGITGTLLLAVCISLIVYFFTKKRKMRWKNMPPGPPPLPILGTIMHMSTKEMPQSLVKLSKQYGPVFTIYMANDPMVVLSGYECVKEALVDRSDAFTARASMELAFLIFKDYDSLFDPTDLLRLAVSNVICSVVFGERFDYEDEKFMNLLNLLEEIFNKLASPWGILLNLFPKLLYCLPGPHQKVFKNTDKMKKFILQSIEYHKKTIDMNCPRDFIDSFLIKMVEEKNNPSTEFHFDNLIGTVTDLFFAGVETTSVTLRHAFLILLKRTDVTRKMQEEIDSVIGQSRCPSASDRISMPYTDAVVHEIQRFADIVPMGVARATSKDTEFRGYHIPKGTMIAPLLTSVHKDGQYFKQPEEFNPGHFLDENGGFRNSDAFLPFSIGKRSCLGEGLARMEIFLFVTTVLQKFNLKTNKAPEDIDITPEPGNNGSLPRSYHMSAESR